MVAFKHNMFTTQNWLKLAKHVSPNTTYIVTIQFHVNFDNSYRYTRIPPSLSRLVFCYCSHKNSRSDIYLLATVDNCCLQLNQILYEITSEITYFSNFTRNFPTQNTYVVKCLLKSQMILENSNAI